MSCVFTPLWCHRALKLVYINFEHSTCFTEELSRSGQLQSFWASLACDQNNLNCFQDKLARSTDIGEKQKSFLWIKTIRRFIWYLNHYTWKLWGVSRRVSKDRRIRDAHKAHCVIARGWRCCVLDRFCNSGSLLCSYCVLLFLTTAGPSMPSAVEWSVQ